MTKASFPTVIDFDILCPHFRWQGRRKIQGKKKWKQKKATEINPYCVCPMIKRRTSSFNLVNQTYLYHIFKCSQKCHNLSNFFQFSRNTIHTEQKPNQSVKVPRGKTADRQKRLRLGCQVSNTFVSTPFILIRTGKESYYPYLGWVGRQVKIAWSPSHDVALPVDIGLIRGRSIL